MNIFILDKDIKKSVEYLVDKHTVKMILETAQLLCTAHHVLGTELDTSLLYKKTHENHPCAKWVRESEENYKWTYNYLLELLKEYTKRYNREHKVSTLINILSTLPKMPENARHKATLPPSCMDEEYKLHITTLTIDDVVDNYRNYYKKGKAHIHNWKVQKPYWI